MVLRVIQTLAQLERISHRMMLPTALFVSRLMFQCILIIAIVNFNANSPKHKVIIFYLRCRVDTAAISLDSASFTFTMRLFLVSRFFVTLAWFGGGWLLLFKLFLCFFQFNEILQFVQTLGAHVFDPADLALRHDLKNFDLSAFRDHILWHFKLYWIAHGQCKHDILPFIVIVLRRQRLFIHCVLSLCPFLRGWEDKLFISKVQPITVPAAILTLLPSHHHLHLLLLLLLAIPVLLHVEVSLSGFHWVWEVVLGWRVVITKSRVLVCVESCWVVWLQGARRYILILVEAVALSE